MQLITFTKDEIQKYLKCVDENLVDLSELEGLCHICGNSLKDIKTPSGPENEVVCLNDREFFIKQYQEFKEEGML